MIQWGGGRRNILTESLWITQADTLALGNPDYQSCNQGVTVCSFHTVSQKLIFIFIHYVVIGFSFLFFLLYNTVLVLPYIDMNPPRVYMRSQSWTLLPPPFPYHLSGSSQCTSPKYPVSCTEPRLVIHFLHIIHVSMPFSQITPPLPLPQSPKVCSIHLCLFCRLAYRVIIMIFLNSIYMC